VAIASFKRLVAFQKVAGFLDGLRIAQLLLLIQHRVEKHILGDKLPSKNAYDFDEAFPELLLSPSSFDVSCTHSIDVARDEPLPSRISHAITSVS